MMDGAWELGAFFAGISGHENRHLTLTLSPFEAERGEMFWGCVNQGGVCSSLVLWLFSWRPYGTDPQEQRRGHDIRQGEGNKAPPAEIHQLIEAKAGQHPAHPHNHHHSDHNLG